MISAKLVFIAPICFKDETKHHTAHNTVLKHTARWQMERLNRLFWPRNKIQWSFRVLARHTAPKNNQIYHMKWQALLTPSDNSVILSGPGQPHCPKIILKYSHMKRQTLPDQKILLYFLGLASQTVHKNNLNYVILTTKFRRFSSTYICRTVRLKTIRKINNCTFF